VKVFADIAGFFALMVSNDLMHMQAKQNFAYFSKNQVQLVTSSFVLVETTALLQRRIGLAPVHDFNAKILPLLDVKSRLCNHNVKNVIMITWRL